MLSRTRRRAATHGGQLRGHVLAALICTGESHGVLESRWLLHLDVRAEGLLESRREDGDLLRLRDIFAASQEQEELLLVIVNRGGAAELCELA